MAAPVSTRDLAPQDFFEKRSFPELTDRLVFAPFRFDPRHQDAVVWWPALIYEDPTEMEARHPDPANKRYRMSLVTLMIRASLEYQGTRLFYIEYLGRPLSDAQVLPESEFKTYFASLGYVMMHMLGRPQYFADKAEERTVLPATYFDFHRGCEEAAKMMDPDNEELPDVLEHAECEWNKWAQTAAPELQQEGVPAATALPASTTTAAATSSARPTGRPGREHMAAAALPGSPNHSIAAVSVAGESMVSATSHLTPASTVATGMTSASAAASRAHHEETSSIPNYNGWPAHMDFPIGAAPWAQVHSSLLLRGWKRYLDGDTIVYSYMNQGPSLTVSQMQALAEQRYGWKREPAQVQTPSPSRFSRRRQEETPSTNAKDYSFGFAWKHWLQPKGWTRVPSRGKDRSLFDYYYLQDYIEESDDLSRYKEGKDYFVCHYAVMDWCRENGIFKDHVESSASEAESVSSFVAEDPSTLLEEVQSELGNKKKNSRKPKKKKKKAKTLRNYSFGVLWAIHLEPSGWTMQRTKRNPLFDYYYVKPGRSVENGEEGKDYFTTTNGVLDYCAANNDYPASSSPETTTTDAMFSTEDEEDEDESTKHPAETEDDQTIGDQTEFSTPGTRTKPQDPSKPLPREDDDECMTDLEARYLWDNLWPSLKKLGWTYERAWNILHDWYYIRPRQIFSDVPRDAMVQGIHYFISPDEVIEYVKKMDQLEAAGMSSSECEAELTKQLDSSQDGSRVTRRKPGSSDEDEPLKTMVSRKKNTRKQAAAEHSKKTKKPNAPKPKDNRPLWCQLNVEVDKDTNPAPWNVDPLPKNNLHKLVTDVGGFRFTGTFYTREDDDSVKFSDMTEAFKYNARLGVGNYIVNKDASAEEKATFFRLCDYAFCPGQDSQHVKTRQLDQDEIEQCLEELAKFEKRADGCWHDTIAGFREKELKPTYSSLKDLLRDLRGVEHLEGPSMGRMRRPTTYQQLLTAFRLSIAEDSIVDTLGRNDEVKSHEPDDNRSKKSATSGDEMDFAKECERQMQSPSKSGRKRRAPVAAAFVSDSAKKRDTEKKENERMMKSIKAHTFLTRNKELGQEINPEIAALASIVDAKWEVAQQLGAFYQSGCYRLNDRYGTRYLKIPIPEYTSSDALFQHIATYGGYNLNDIKEDFRNIAKLELACANVPEFRREWPEYRMLEDHEGTTLLGTLGFKRPTPGSEEWVVPQRLLEYTNPYVEGSPRLLKETYSSTDELRVALRSVPDLEHGLNEGRGRRRENTLNKDVMLVLRLWIATGPAGPDAVVYEMPPSDNEGFLEATTEAHANTEGTDAGMEVSSPNSQFLATQEHQGFPSPTRHEDLLTQPNESDDDDEVMESLGNIDFGNETPSKHENPHQNLLTQAPMDEE